MRRRNRHVEAWLEKWLRLYEQPSHGHAHRRNRLVHFRSGILSQLPRNIRSTHRPDLTILLLPGLIDGVAKFLQGEIKYRKSLTEQLKLLPSLTRGFAHPRLRDLLDVVVESRFHRLCTLYHHLPHRHLDQKVDLALASLDVHDIIRERRVVCRKCRLRLQELLEEHVFAVEAHVLTTRGTARTFRVRPVQPRQDALLAVRMRALDVLVDGVCQRTETDVTRLHIRVGSLSLSLAALFGRATGGIRR